jgi:hypothetical protein
MMQKLRVVCPAKAFPQACKGHELLILAGNGIGLLAVRNHRFPSDDAVSDSLVEKRRR